MSLKYFDYNSTTPIDNRVSLAIYYFSRYFYGNYSSFHRMGEKTNYLTKKYTKYIAKTINTQSRCILYTSGATESNNIAVQGLIKYFSVFKTKIHIICPIIEHDSIIGIIKQYERKGLIEITWLNVCKSLVYSGRHFEEHIRENTKLIICMHVNNEIGVINDISSIGALCKKNNIHFHVDAAQSYGKIPIDVEKENITTMSVSGHKIYATKGIGFLYYRKKHYKAYLKPLLFGGSQQGLLRSGTMPTELICGLYTAIKICMKEMQSEYQRLREMQIYMHKEIIKNTHAILNGPIDSNRIHNNLNYSFYGIEGESIVGYLYDFCLSTGSACNSSTLEPSSVIESFSDKELVHSSLRISIGRYTTMKDINLFLSRLFECIAFLKKASPV